MDRKIILKIALAGTFAFCIVAAGFQIKSRQMHISDEQTENLSEGNTVSCIQWRLFQQPDDGQRYGNVTLTLAKTLVMDADAFLHKPGVEFVLKNDSDYEIVHACPAYIQIQKKMNEKWYDRIIYPQKDDAGVEHSLMTKSEEKFYVSMEELFPETEINPGEYRACVRFDYVLGTDDMGGNLYEASCAFAEFTLK